MVRQLISTRPVEQCHRRTEKKSSMTVGRPTYRLTPQVYDPPSAGCSSELQFSCTQTDDKKCVINC